MVSSAQKVIVNLLWSETLPYTWFIRFNESSLPFYSTSNGNYYTKIHYVNFTLLNNYAI